MIYFIGDDLGHVKIGFTRGNPRSRLYAFQMATPQKLRILRLAEGDTAVEHWFHERFASLHIRGEWHRFDPEMLTVMPPDVVRQKKLPQLPVTKPSSRARVVEPPEGPMTPDEIKRLPAFFLDLAREADRLGVMGPYLRERYAPVLEERHERDQQQI